jgi:hypothetical protein
MTRVDMAATPRPGTPARSGGPLAASLLVALALLALAAVPTSAAPATGDRVRISGVVTDSQGRPLSGLRVVLEASRRSFSVREMRRADRDTRRVAATTNERGEYSIEWPFDPYFNQFQLLAGLPLRKGAGGERLDELARQEVTQRVLLGGPVVAALVVANPQRIETMRRFLSGLDSEDERRVYGEMGSPDEVKRVRYPDHEEVSWWYFESGRMYRFRDGALEQVVPFDPVKSF